MNQFGQPIGLPVDTWQGARMPQPEALAGAVVTLESVAAEHGPQIAAHLSDLASWTYRPGPPPADAADATRMAVAWAADPAVATYAIVPKTSGEVEGLASLMRCDPAHGSIEVGAILYADSLKGTRAATEAMHLLATYVFDELGYRRYEWKCDSLNEPSRRAAVRLGFTYEGRFRNALVYKGRNRDTDWFSITSEEWPAVKAAHRTWLADENFDDAGRQRQRLRAHVTE